MKKFLSCLMAIVMLGSALVFAPAKNTAVKAANTDAFVGTSLYIDDQVDLKLFFDAEILSKSGSFSLTTSFNNKTYTAADLVSQKDIGTGKTYKVLSVGPFAVTQFNTKYTYSGSAMEGTTFSLVDLAKTSISHYKSQSGYRTNAAMQDTVKILEAFVNYGIAVYNYQNPGDKHRLPYTPNITASKFVPHPGIEEKNGTKTTTPLKPARAITGRSFVLDQDIYLSYTGALQSGDDLSTWTITLNNVDVTKTCDLKKNGETFSFTVPIHADQGAEGLRIVIRDKTNTVLYDVMDRADSVALLLGEEKGWSEVSQTLAAYLQAASNYAYSPNPGPIALSNGTFYAGYGKVDLTPYASAVALNSANATEFTDSIHASCVALRDKKGTTILIMSLDVRNIQSLRNQVYQTLRDKVSQATGVPADNIYFNATHTHSAPNVGSSSSTVTDWYENYFYPRVPAAAKKALEDLTAVTGAYTGETVTANGTNYNRRYRPGGYEDDADKTLRTIRFTRKEGKDILLVNWQCHAAHGSGVNPDKGGSDFINELRLVIEKEKSEGGMGMHLVYINGASGDLNMTPKAQSTHPDYLAMGRSVAKSIQKLVGSSKEKKVETGDINVKADSIFADLHYRLHADGKTYCYDANCAACKREYLTLSGTSWSSSGKFFSANQYNAFIDQKNNGNLNNHPRDISLWTVTIGDSIGFAFVPYEMFNQNGVDLRSAVNAATGGNKTIFTAGYTNGYLGYMPSETAWVKVDNADGIDDGAYEVHTARYVRGTAERCVNKLTENLTAQFK